MKLIEYTINELASIQHPCSCGKMHHIGIDHIAIGKGAVEKLPEFLADQKLHDGSKLTMRRCIRKRAISKSWKMRSRRGSG